MAEHARHPNGRSALPRIRTLSAGSPTQTSPLAAVFTRESLLRLALSFVLALALWLYVTGKENPNVAINLEQPLSIVPTRVGVGLIVTNLYQFPTAHVRYRTTSPTTPVSSANFRVFVDLLNAKPGIHRHVRVGCESDPGIACVNVTPSYIDVALDTVQDTHVPVRAKTTGQPAAGYFGTAPHFFPSTVDVSGPHTVVSQVRYAQVNLDISGLSSSLDGPYRPTLVGPQDISVAGAARLSVTPSQVTVHLAIRALSSFKQLPVLVSLKGQPKSGFGVTSVIVSPPEVTVQGSPKELRKLSSLSTQPVYLKGKRSTFSRNVRLQLPAGVTTPTRSVVVKTKIQPVDSTLSVGVPVTVVGAGSGFDVHTNPPKELIAIVGPANAIREVGGGIHVLVNVSGYGAGTYELAPKVTVPPGFHIANIYPDRLTVSVVNQAR